MKRVNDLYVLKNYYRTEIKLDTAHDASHLLSVMTSFCPAISYDMSANDKTCYLNNVRNHMHQRVKITWTHQI